MINLKNRLVFVKWKGDYALFRKATMVDLLIVSTGVNLLCELLNIKEGKIYLIKIPKIIMAVKKK